MESKIKLIIESIESYIRLSENDKKFVEGYMMGVLSHTKNEKKEE